MSGTNTQRAEGVDAARLPGPDVEPSDTPSGRVALALAGLVGTLLLVCASVGGLLVLFDHHAPPAAPHAPPALAPPEPRLQVHEPPQRVLLAARADAALRPAPGRIGIDAAMRRVAARGWPR